MKTLATMIALLALVACEPTTDQTTTYEYEEPYYDSYYYYEYEYEHKNEENEENEVD